MTTKVSHRRFWHPFLHSSTLVTDALFPRHTQDDAILGDVKQRLRTWADANEGPSEGGAVMGVSSTILLWDLAQCSSFDNTPECKHVPAC